MIGPVRVWIVPVDVPPHAVAGFADVLNDAERTRAGALLSSVERKRFAVAHGVLRILVARELDVDPAGLTWIPGRYGKPELASPWSGLHTSLSHSADLIAVALSPEYPVGVDIQHLVSELDTVALSARFFRPDEAAYVAAGSDAGARADRFAHLWVRKEAVVKAAGGRLWSNLTIAVRDRDVVACADPASSHRVADVAAPDGYRAAVAIHAADPFAVQAIEWEATDWVAPEPSATGSPL